MGLKGLRPESIDTSARRFFGELLALEVTTPIDDLWDLRNAVPRIVVPLVSAWPCPGMRALLTCDARVLPLRWRVELELDGAPMPVPPSTWTRPSAHDPLLGWTYRPGTEGAPFVDFDGLSAWPLTTAEDPTPGWRVLTSLGHVMDLRGTPDAWNVIATRSGRIDAVPLDAEGRLSNIVLRARDREEELVRLHWDDAGCVRTIERTGRPPIELTYDADGRPTSARGETSVVEYSYVGVHEGRIGAARVESARGRFEVLHPTTGQAIVVDARSGAMWSSRTDAAGNVVEVQTPSSAGSLALEPETGVPVEIVRGAQRHHFYYDADGYVVYTDGSAGAATELRYDPSGRLIHAERGDAQLVRRAFDLAGRLSASLGVELGWDERGELAYLRDLGGERRVSCSEGSVVESALGPMRWKARRDGLGRIIDLHGPEGEVFELRRSRDGRVTSWTAGEALRRTIAWSESGAILGHRDEGDELAYVRDAAGRIVSVPQFDISVRWDPAGPAHVTGCGIDVRSERGVIETDDVAQGLLRDDMGQITARHGGGRPSLRLAYSPAGHVVRCEIIERGPSPADVPPAERTFEGIERVRAYQFEHDESGLLTRAIGNGSDLAIRRRAGRIVEEILDGARLGIARDDAGYRTEVQTSRGLSVEHRRDAGHRIQRVAARFAGRSIEIELTYDQNGRERTRSMAGVEVQLMRDELGRLVRRRVVFGGHVLDVSEVTWRGGRVQRVQGGGAFPTQDCRYAASGTLVELREADAVFTASEPFRGHIAPGCEYDDAGRPRTCGTVRYGHDAAGRLEWRVDGGDRTELGYDAFDRLVRVESARGVVSIDHDALGRRLRTRVGANTIEYGWDGDRLIHRASGGTETAYVDADGVPLAMFIGDTPYLVLPGTDSSAAGIIGADGALATTRSGATQLLGAIDDGVPAYHAPEIARHCYDELTGFWFSLRGDLDPMTARYLQPASLAHGPWRYARRPDPRLHEHVPWNEIAAPDFATFWSELTHASLCDDRESGASWHTFADSAFPDAERLLLP